MDSSGVDTRQASGQVQRTYWKETGNLLIPDGNLTGSKESSTIAKQSPPRSKVERFPVIVN